MNLREAIEAGAERVDGPTRGAFLRVRYGGGVVACALGAAYIGCHPDDDLAVLEANPGRVQKWAQRVGAVVAGRHGLVGYGYDNMHIDSAVMRVNDQYQSPVLAWPEILAELGGLAMDDGTPVLDVEVCETPEDCAGV